MITIEQLRKERLERLREQRIDHDHREVVCDERHWQWWINPKIEPLTKEFIAERFADIVSKEIYSQSARLKTD